MKPYHEMGLQRSAHYVASLEGQLLQPVCSNCANTIRHGQKHDQSGLHWKTRIALAPIRDSVSSAPSHRKGVFWISSCMVVNEATPTSIMHWLLCVASRTRDQCGRLSFKIEAMPSTFARRDNCRRGCFAASSAKSCKMFSTTSVIGLVEVLAALKGV